MKKQYVSPELEVMFLEQADIITVSGVVNDGKYTEQNGSKPGIMDNWK